MTRICGLLLIAGSRIAREPGRMNLRIRKLLASLRYVAGPTYPKFDRLVDCPSCGSDVMNPVRWHELDESTWWIRLRCGECGFVREVEATNEEAERLDADLIRGISEIAQAVAKLDRRDMAAVSDALTAALERDLIDADDFGR